MLIWFPSAPRCFSTHQKLHLISTRNATPSVLFTVVFTFSPGLFATWNFSPREKHGTDVSKILGVKKFLKDGEKIYSILFLVFAPCGQDYRGAIIPSQNEDLNIAQWGPPSLRREELWHALALRNLPGVPICIKGSLNYPLKNTTKKEKTPTCALGSHWRTYSNGCWLLSNKHHWKASDSWVEGGIAPNDGKF